MNDCVDIEGQLVAWQDGALPLAAARHVEAHLARCVGCRALESSLRAVTPIAGPGLPEALRQTAWARIDRAIAAERAREDTPPLGWRDRWNERVPLPRAAVMGYLVVLCLVGGWGLANWWSASALRAEVAAYDRPMVPASTPLPVVDFRPAAFSLPADEEPVEPEDGRLTFEAARR